MDRRELLKVAALSGVAVGVANPVISILSSGVAGGATNNETVAFPGDYIEGTVSAVAPGTLSVMEADGSTINFTVPPAASVWRGTSATPAAIQVGDSVMTTSTVSASGVRTLVNLSANESQVKGQVLAVDTGSLVVQDQGGGTHAFVQNDATQIVTPNDWTPLEQNALVLVHAYSPPGQTPVAVSVATLTPFTPF